MLARYNFGSRMGWSSGYCIIRINMVVELAKTGMDSLEQGLELRHAKFRAFMTFPSMVL